MTNEILLLSLTAAAVGFTHTILGPDHYIPFIVMSKAGKWSQRKTFWITFFSGIGHVLSSILLGFAGVAFGLALEKLTDMEAFRGSLAGWFLLAFGLAYTIYGIKKAIRNKPHVHKHFHTDGSEHVHKHSHADEHVHVHEKEKSANLTPWIIFTIFVFGPCEPLIPLIIYPAAQESTVGLIWVSVVFAAATIGTMLTIVTLAIKGLEFVPLQKLERYTHLLAGLFVLISGVAVQFLGL